MPFLIVIAVREWPSIVDEVDSWRSQQSIAGGQAETPQTVATGELSVVSPRGISSQLTVFPISKSQERWAVLLRDTRFGVTCDTGQRVSYGTAVGLNVSVESTLLVTGLEALARCKALQVTDGYEEVPAKIESTHKESGLALISVPLPLDRLAVRVQSLPSGDSVVHVGIQVKPYAKSGGVQNQPNGTFLVAGDQKRELHPGSVVVNSAGEVIAFTILKEGRIVAYPTMALCGKLIACK